MPARARCQNRAIVHRFNFVCFDCRLVRRASRRAAPICPACRDAMQSIGLSQASSRSDAAAWSQMRRRWLLRSRESAHRSAIAGIRITSAQQQVEQILEHRHLHTRAARRKLARAGRAYALLQRTRRSG